jgi:hypothetical protein
LNQIVKSILATARAVGTLGKGALNPHGNYNYVSIDKFYESVARIANENGLNWVLRETLFEVLPNVGKTGAIRVSYAVDMMHEAGETRLDFSQISIIHPVQGAQTVGSSMSYADKVLMRQLFKVPTGEKDIDADETDNRALDLGPTKPEPKKVSADKPVSAPPAPKIDVPIDVPGEEADWSAVEATFKNFIGTCMTTDGLKEFWSENVKVLEGLKEGDPKMHKRVVDLFTNRKNELKGVK